jgi:hypothetical protein
MGDAHGEVPGLRPGRVEDHADFVRLFGELGVEEPPPPLDVWVSELMARVLPGRTGGPRSRRPSRWCRASWPASPRGEARTGC